MNAAHTDRTADARPDRVHRAHRVLRVAVVVGNPKAASRTATGRHKGTFQGLARARGRGPADRIECETDGFFERVRGADRRRAGEDAGRWRVIDASQPVDAVLAALDVALDAYFGGTA